MAAEQLEHVVEEADPGRDGHVAAVEVERDLDLRLAGLALDISAVRLIAVSHSPRSRVGGLAVHRKALGARQAAHVGGERSRAAAPGSVTTEVRRRNVPARAGRRSVPRRRWAARGWSPPRSRRTRSPRPRRRTRSLRPGARASVSSAPSKASSRCSGATASASVSAASSPRVGTSASGASVTLGALGDELGDQLRDRVEKRRVRATRRSAGCPRRARPGRRGRARSSPRVRGAVGDDHQLARPRDPVDADPPARPAAWPR